MAMASSSSKNQPPKTRKRVDAGPPSNLKRGSNGSAFTRCNACNKDIPVATADMHDCVQDAKTKAVLAKPVETLVKDAVPSKEDNDVPEKKPRKRKAASRVVEKSKQQKKSKKEKDPNEPKRPMTAFFLFMEGFRKTYKEANPNAKGGTLVAKEGGDKWKSMSDEEKAPFVQKVAEMKQEYEKALKAYRSKGKDSIENSSEDAAGECDGNNDVLEDNLRSAESTNESEQ